MPHMNRCKVCGGPAPLTGGLGNGICQRCANEQAGRSKGPSYNPVVTRCPKCGLPIVGKAHHTCLKK